MDIEELLDRVASPPWGIAVSVVLLVGDRRRAAQSGSSAVKFILRRFFTACGLKFFLKDFEDDLVLKDPLMCQIYDMVANKPFTIPNCDSISNSRLQ